MLFTPIQTFYFHVNRSIGIVQKIDFEIRPDLGYKTLKTSIKVVLNNPSVRPSVLLSLFPRTLTGVTYARGLGRTWGRGARVGTPPPGAPPRGQSPPFNSCTHPLESFSLHSGAARKVANPDFFHQTYRNKYFPTTIIFIHDKKLW